MFWYFFIFFEIFRFVPVGKMHVLTFGQSCTVFSKRIFNFKQILYFFSAASQAIASYASLSSLRAVSRSQWTRRNERPYVATWQRGPCIHGKRAIGFCNNPILLASPQLKIGTKMRQFDLRMYNVASARDFFILSCQKTYISREFRKYLLILVCLTIELYFWWIKSTTCKNFERTVQRVMYETSSFFVYHVICRNAFYGCV